MGRKKKYINDTEEVAYLRKLEYLKAYYRRKSGKQEPYYFTITREPVKIHFD